MFDVGDRDLPVPTSGNWVIKGSWLNGYVFNVLKRFFFENPKNMTFYVFWVVAHVFSNTAPHPVLVSGYMMIWYDTASFFAIKCIKPCKNSLEWSCTPSQTPPSVGRGHPLVALATRPSRCFQLALYGVSYVRARHSFKMAAMTSFREMPRVARCMRYGIWSTVHLYLFTHYSTKNR